MLATCVKSVDLAIASSIFFCNGSSLSLAKCILGYEHRPAYTDHSHTETVGLLAYCMRSMSLDSLVKLRYILVPEDL